jgi:hypothetical protein
VEPEPRRPRREAGWLLVLALAALLPRLAYVTTFPHRQFLDFRTQVEFAQEWNERPFAAGSVRWANIGPGVAIALAPVLRAVPAPPLDVARLATAIVTALAALLPFLLWRGVCGLATRVIASALLALWPGHIVFSGVVAQDNWVLPPAIALACLAIRTLRGAPSAHPAVVAFLYVAAIAIRPDMLVVLCPLVLAAAGLLRCEWRPRAVAATVIAIAIGLVLLAGLRWAGSGRFRVSPEHAGLATLGAFIPGAGVSWAATKPYFAAVAPNIVESDVEMRRAAPALVWRELRRRPAFHAVRSFASTAVSIVSTDTEGLFWSLGFDGALPEPTAARAALFVARVQRPIAWSTALALAVILAAIGIAILRRDAPVLVIASAMALKVGVHCFVNAQGRYYVPVLALGMLIVALTVEDARRRRLGGRDLLVLAPCLVLVLGLRGAAARAEAYVITHQEQLTYRFTLRDPGYAAHLDCVVREGLVSLLWAGQARAGIRLLDIEPRSGESAAAECEARTDREGPVFLMVSDSFAAGGFPDRIVQTVTIEGREVLRRDAAAEANTWARVPLGTLRPGDRRHVVVRMTAGAALPGPRWGNVNTEIRIATE